MEDLKKKGWGLSINRGGSFLNHHFNRNIFNHTQMSIIHLTLSPSSPHKEEKEEKPCQRERIIYLLF